MKKGIGMEMGAQIENHQNLTDKRFTVETL
jgi:hypothetical protein